MHRRLGLNPIWGHSVPTDSQMSGIQLFGRLVAVVTSNTMFCISGVVEPQC